MACVLAWAALSGLASGQSPLAGGAAPVIWGQDVFAIPYQWKGQTDPSLARQVVLHLSTDGGATWRRVSTAEPRVQSFTYRAPRDGAYWFAVRTIDNAGRSWPTGPLTPELHVVVDTQVPVIGSLSASINRAGELTLGCVVRDTTLDESAVTASVQTGGGWVGVPVQTSFSADGQSLTVRGVANVGAGVTQSVVRVDVRDRAGNPASAGVTAVLGAASPTTAPFGFASGSASSSALGPPALAADTSTVRDPFLGQAPTFGPPVVATKPVTRPAPTTSPYTSVLKPAAPPAVIDNPWHSSRGAEPLPLFAQGSSSGGAEVWAPDGISRTPFRGEARGLTPVEPATPLLSATPTPRVGAPNPPVDVYRSSRPAGPPSSFASLSPGMSRVAPPAMPPQDFAIGSSLGQAPPAFRTAPLPENAQFVGTKRFELDYDVTSAGKWGVAKVTLWGTRDRGRSWRAFAVDGDNRSPLDVAVADEGLYGFRITVEGVGGLTPSAPEPGDAPEMWVEVDQTIPEVRLTAAHQGEGYFGDHLVINWQADDANLSARPITISYAARRDGPWAPMASSIENSGRYAWRLQRHVPGQIFLRVEATDAAGNRGVAVTPQPLTITLPQPTATMGTVRPFGG